MSISLNIARLIYDSGEPLSTQDVINLADYPYHRVSAGMKRLAAWGYVIQAGEYVVRTGNKRSHTHKLWQLTQEGEDWVLTQQGQDKARPVNLRIERFRWACRPLVQGGGV